MRILKTAAALSCAMLFLVAGGRSGFCHPDPDLRQSGWYQNSGFTAGVNLTSTSARAISAARSTTTGLPSTLAGLAAQTVTGATLTFYGGNGVNTSSTSETLGLFDYTGSINSILAESHSSMSASIPTWATAIATARRSSPAGRIQQFSVALSQQAIADLNAAAQNLSDTRFVIGGSLLSISGPFANEQLFAIFGPQSALVPAAFLDLQTVAAPVPEPSTWAMMLLGIGGVVMMTLRRKQKKLDPSSA